MENFKPTRRSELENLVESVLSAERDGRLLKTDESEALDFKEEAGRRRGRELEPGQPTNPEAAQKLADEVACMANSPGGGVLIVGVEDRSGRLIGTELDSEWLRQKIHHAVDVAPRIDVRHVAGFRLLVIYVAEAREPVPDTGNNLRWRVGDSCTKVDRAEWWAHRDRARGLDPLAARSDKNLDAVRPHALELAQSWSRDHSSTPEEYLRKIGALSADGYLTVAAEILFTDTGRTWLSFAAIDVEGGHVLDQYDANPRHSLLEQIAAIEQRVDAHNTTFTQKAGLSHRRILAVPQEAAREAMLNGLIHRDLERREPTDIRWMTLDSTHIVRSPGAFPDAISTDNILSNRNARYPALADLFRAISLVEKQGLGVDRMYLSMMALGHRPPLITEVAGPFVECILQGGEPLYPMISLVDHLRPQERASDLRIIAILYRLLTHAFITTGEIASILQNSSQAAEIAISAARQTTIAGHPLIESIQPSAWVLGKGARSVALEEGDACSADDFVGYLNPTTEGPLTETARQWLHQFEEITTGQLMSLCDIGRTKARRILDGLVSSGEATFIKAGRSSRYRAIVATDTPGH
ncbi:DUF5635 domain-containing protein [Corynebacterium sp. CCM 9203]|uniref:DUF5635 domain-containing protein n=1 Tax=Corynebacterium sp. CCM 9203 TaxID=3057615 RepID=UPI00352521C1